MIRNTLKILLPVAILSISLWWANTWLTTPSKGKKRATVTDPVVTVDTLTAIPREYPVTLYTQGVVRPRTETTLIAQVSGKVVWVSENFRVGGDFRKGQLLVKIDSRDYEIALRIAQAELRKVELTLVEEQARAEQALKNWQQLPSRQPASDLLLRKPQLAAVKAAVQIAKGRIEQAQLPLARSRIYAPYDGRLLSQLVDVGQVVNSGRVLAKLYDHKALEVRLPLTKRQYQRLNLPAKVAFYRNSADSESLLKGQVLRSEGVIDVQTRQWWVIAVLDAHPDIQIGQFLSARIVGRPFPHVFVIPRRAFRRQDILMVVDEQQRLQRRTLSVVWRDENNLLVADGLSAGERISLTPTPFNLGGVKVRVKNGQDAP
jgi:membrane fusion protein, multidrug efflux system